MEAFNRSGGRGSNGTHARNAQPGPSRNPVMSTPSPESSSYMQMSSTSRPDSAKHASPFSNASASASRLIPFDTNSSDFYARAQAMGLRLSREDLERTRAGVAAIVKRNRTSPASSVLAHAPTSSSPCPPTMGGPVLRKVTTPHSGSNSSSSSRRSMALSSGGSQSAGLKPTLEQISIRKEQDGDDRRRKRQRRISESTPNQPVLQPGLLHTLHQHQHYHHHQHNLLSSSSSQFIDSSSPGSHFDPFTVSAPRWKWMDRSGRPRTRPRMTLDEVGVRAEEGSDEKRKSRRRRRTAEESGAELTDNDSVRPDEDDMLPLLRSLHPTHPPSSLYTDRRRNVAEDSHADLTDTDSLRPEEEDMLPLLLSRQPPDLPSSSLPVLPPSAPSNKTDEYLQTLLAYPTVPIVAQEEPVADESIAGEPPPSSAADLSKSRSDMEDEGDTSASQLMLATDEFVEAWDYNDGTRVVKLVSEELAYALRAGTLSESDIEPRYYTLPVHWGKEKMKPSHASYAGLIGLAILSSSDGKLGLAEIYQWITATFPHYEMRDRGWQNSIRHNLSLNKSFIKVERSLLEKGKGALWSIAPGHECRFENGTYNAKKAIVSQPAGPGQGGARHDVTEDEADDEGDMDDSHARAGSSSGASRNASTSKGGMSSSTADALALMKKHGGSQVLCYTLQHGTSHRYHRLKRDPVQDVAKGLAVAVTLSIPADRTGGETSTPRIGSSTSLPALVPASQESVRTETSLPTGSFSSTPARPLAPPPQPKRGRRSGGAVPSKAAQVEALSQAVSKAETAAARAAAKVGVVASQDPASASASAPVVTRSRKRIPLKDKTNVGVGIKAVPAVQKDIFSDNTMVASTAAAKGKGKAEDPVKVTTTAYPQISMGAPFHSPKAPSGPTMMGAFTPGPANSSNNNTTTRWPMRSPISSLRSSMGGALKSGSGSVMLPIAGLTPARRILGGHTGLGSQFSPLFNTPGGLGSGMGMELGLGVGGVGGGNNGMGLSSLRSAAMGAGTGLGSVMSPVHPLGGVLQTPARGMLSGSAMGGDEMHHAQMSGGGGAGRHRRRESTGPGAGMDGPSLGGNSSQWIFSSTPIRRLMSGAAGSESAGRGMSNLGNIMSSPISSSIHERTGSPYARSNRSHAGSGGGHPSSSIGSTSTPSAAVPGSHNRSTGLTPAGGDAHWLGDPFGYQGNFSHELAFTTEMGGLGTGIDSSPAKDLWRS
ncbi:unnamed protein product [Tilletia laevis]|nr:hypothetical protein CF336_g3210 [Tilletia laevis]CAD6932046.1 unnamed protein product [Tilletia laevis]